MVAKTASNTVGLQWPGEVQSSDEARDGDKNEYNLGVMLT